MDRQQPQDEVPDQDEAVPFRAVPAAFQLRDQALHPPAGDSRISGPEDDHRWPFSAPFDVVRRLLVVAAMPCILFGVLEQDAVELLQGVLGHCQRLVLLADQLKEISVSTYFLLVTRAEAVDLQACENVTDLLIGQLGPLDPSRGADRFDRGPHPQLLDSLGRLRLQLLPPAREPVDPADDGQEVPTIVNRDQNGVGKNPGVLRRQDCHYIAIVLPSAMLATCWQSVGNGCTRPKAPTSGERLCGILGVPAWSPTRVGVRGATSRSRHTGRAVAGMSKEASRGKEAHD